MKILDYLKNAINKMKNLDKNVKLIEAPVEHYKDLIQREDIEKIICSMPSDLSKLEKAYYIYIELGKLLKENPLYVFNDVEGKMKYYNDKIEKNYYGICKSISEFYVEVLKDERIGINAEVVKQTESPLTHVDTLLKINGKKYLVNLISDLSRIKSSRRTNRFCFDLNVLDIESLTYLRKLERKHGRISSLTVKDIEKLDKKLGYSFYVSEENVRGIYTDDTIALLANEINDPKLFKEYVLQGKDVPEKEELKYKLDYIFSNIDKLTEFNGEMGYLENIRYYEKVAEKVLSPKDTSRICAYVATVKNDFSNIISIIKVKPYNKEDGAKGNIYYMYSNEEKKYVGKTPEEVSQFIEKIDKDSLQIIGKYDRYSPGSVGEIEV